MSSLLDHLDSNQSENDDIHLLFPKCKPRASSVGTESQSSESQSNSQQYLADNFRDQNLNHPSSASIALGGIAGSVGGISSQSSRQSSRRHSSSGFTHHPSQQHHSQILSDNLVKHSKHSSYPPLINTQTSPTTSGNNTFIGHAPLSPYDNNNLTHDIVASGKTKSETRSSQSSHHHSSSRHHNHHHSIHHQQQTQHQSDSSDNFPLTNFGGNCGTANNNKSEGYHHQNHHHSISNIKSYHLTRSKNTISSRNSRHEAALATASSGQSQSQSGRHHSRSSHHHNHHHHHHHHSSHHNNSERPHHHHRSKKLTHTTESSSCEPISPQQVIKSSLPNSRYSKNQKSSLEGAPTKSYSTLSLGSGMECEALDDHHIHRQEQLYDDGFCTTRSQRNLATSNGTSGEHISTNSSRTISNNLPGNGGCLRDSRIEIAGGREIYSQNRIRAGRRLRGSSSTSSSTEMMADSSISMTATSSSSSAPVPNKARKKSPNVQQQQQQQPLACTNGDVGGETGELSIWEPKHSSKQYQENIGAPTRAHHGSSHRHGSQHHHPHNHHHHHSQQHHHSLARSRHCCGYPHCDHSKALSPTDLSPACGVGGGSYNKSPCGEHNNTPGMTVKETVFSTEITSIEKPIESENAAGKLMRSISNSASNTGQNTVEAPYVYETNVNDSGGGGEIIFDDIGGSWQRNGEDGGRSAPDSSGGCGGGGGGGGLRAHRKDSIKRSPSGGGRQTSQHGSHPNYYHHSGIVRDIKGGSGGMHCCGSLEQINHSGSSINANPPPTVLLQGSPSPSTRGGNTTPSGYESDEYSGVMNTPVSLNVIGCGSNKGCLPNNRLIGAVELAEYEGSPKRYGLRQLSHPLPTHLDLVDVDIQMNSSLDNDHDNRSPTDINSRSGNLVSGNHVAALMSPTQPGKSSGTVPTTASSSSSSLDNTSSNVSSSSTSSSNNNKNLNFYNSRISPRVLSPSQSISSFPSRVPGFPQRITPVTSSLDSSSLVDSGLEKSEATDTKSDSILETEGGVVDEMLVETCHRHDESPQKDQIIEHQYHHHQSQTHHHQPQQKCFRSSEVDELTSPTQGQVVNNSNNSEHHHHHHNSSSSDLLLTDQLNSVKAEKCIPSSTSNTTNLCGNPLDESEHIQHPQQQQQQQLQQYHMVLELVDSAVPVEDHHQSLQHNQQQHQHTMIHSVTGVGEDGTKSNSNVDSVDEQCLISVPSSNTTNNSNSHQHGESLDGHSSNLFGAGATCSSSEYLYEFSETRKVLEEFFGSTCGAGGSGGGGGSNVQGVSSSGGIMGLDGNSVGTQGNLFDDLDYTLKRQTGNSYVGQRLAGESCSAVEESPKKPARRGVLLLGSSDGDGGEGGEAASPRLISFQEITLPQLQQQQLHHHQDKSLQNPPRDLNDNDIDGDTSSSNTETDNLGDTEVGLQVGLSRNFTLSPETTDCDSNELESEISLDYEASLHSSSRVGASMPAVEDGLSSGNVSDTEELAPSSEQLNNEFKKVSHHHQQGLLCSNTSATGNTITSSNNSTSPHNNRHQLGQRRDHRENISGPHSHHYNYHSDSHKHLIEDGLGGTPQQGVSTITSSLSSSNLHSAQSIQQTSALSLCQQQSQHPASPSSSAASISNSKIPSDPNPTLLLMKKQISEIEKEIKMRASQQNQKMQLQHHSSIVDNSTLNNTNSIMPLVTDEANNDSNSCSTTNIASSLSNGNSCGITTNGNGLNITSSCPDVSALSSSSSNATSGSGQGVCYPQQQGLSSASSSNNNGPGSHHRDSLPIVSNNTSSIDGKGQETTNFDSIDIELEALDPMRPTPPPSPAPSSLCQPQTGPAPGCASNNHNRSSSSSIATTTVGNSKVSSSSSSSTTATAAPINIPTVSGPPGSSSCNISNANARILTSSGGDSNPSVISPDSSSSSSSSVAAAIQDIKEAIQRTKTLPRQQPSSHVETSRPSPLTSAQSHADAHNSDTSPVWVPRQGPSSYHHHRSGERGVKDPLLRKQRYDETPDDDADTDQETDRLLGQTRTEDDYGFYDEKEWKKVKNCRSLLPALNKGVSFVKSAASGSVQPLGLSTSASSLNTGSGGGAGSNSNSNHGVPSYSSTSNTIAPSSARISPAPFKQQQEPLPTSQLNSSSSNNTNSISNKPKKEKDGIKKKRSKEDLKNPSVLIEGVLFRARYLGSTQLVCEGQPTKATRMMQAEEAVSRIKTQVDQSDLSSETEPLGTHIASDSAEPGILMHTSSSTATTASSSSNNSNNDKGEQAIVQPPFEDYLYAEDDDSGDESCAESEFFHKGHHSIQSPTSSARSFQAPCFGGTSPADPGTLSSSVHFGPACGSALPGTMFRLKFIGSLEVDEEVGSGKRRRKRPKKTMVEEAVLKMKAPEGETQPSTEVDLFISTEKIMVLNTDLKEIMMDHALRTISYIADIGDLVVLMARRRPVPSDTPDDSKIARPPKMICHVFESDEAQYIAQSIGQAFQVAYMEFLKANGIEDQSFVREMDYQEVLNSQEIFGDELQMFAKKELQKEVVVPKSKGEILGVVIVESGWGSMLPTVVIANLAPSGAAARCGQLNIGDQIIAINGVSLVGLPLSTCQNYIKNTKSQTVVKLTVVPCPPVVEVKIKRPDTKYQLGFSVQNGVICSLLRGGIAERGGVRVGHRIIEINGQSVVAVPHEKIVNLLATSVGEINMKTMPTSMFRLLTGQETPLYI